MSDIALTNATWLTYTDEYFQCEATEMKLRKRRDADTAIAHVRKEKGCGVINNSPKVVIDNIEYYSCLCHKNFKDETLNNYIWVFNQFSKGTLAYEGSLLEQPAKYIELMRFIEKLNSEYEEKINKQHNENKG